jgi:RNA polymerase sigma factor, sigma-70 family
MSRNNAMAQETPTITKVQKRQPNHVCGRPCETDLLGRAQDGCSDSFGLLCAPHAGGLLKTAFRITRNKEDAEDAVQESLMRAFVGIHEFRGAASFSTWLTRIVINSALMIQRKKQKTRWVSLDTEFEATGHLNFEIKDSAPDPEQKLVALERQRALRKAISNLRPRVRAVLEAGHLRGFSMKETAKVLNISLTAAKGRLFQGRGVLRKSGALRGIVRSRTETAA